MNIFLDDIRTPIDDYNWVVIRNYDEFVTLINDIGDLGKIELISLDHDLGETAIKEYFVSQTTYKINYNRILEKTGLDCAKYLVDYYLDRVEKDRVISKSKINFPEVRVHSANPIGSANIIGYINNFLKNERQLQTCVRWHPNYKVS